MDPNDQPGSASVQHDQPAEQHIETREETIERVVDSTEAVTAERGGSADPSSRRGLNRLLARTLSGFGLAGAVFGALLALLLSFLPGPIETHDVLGVIGYMIVLGAAFALGFAVIGTLLNLAREDGRVEREVEEATGNPPEGIAGPVSPKHDPTPR